MNKPIDGTISLQFLRELIAPCKGSSFDSWAKDPVYLNIGGRFYEIADITSVAGPYESHTEIQAGREVTERETRASKDRKVIDGWAQVRGL